MRAGIVGYPGSGKSTVFQALAPGALGSLLCAIAYTGVCWLLGYALDRRGIVVRL